MLFLQMTLAIIQQIIAYMQGELIKKEAVQIPDPVYYAAIQFDDGEAHVQYTDCWEISVLRLLHFLFGKAGNISNEKLTKYMDLQDAHCQALLEYFTQNPTYYLEDKFYGSEQGLKLRAEWCQFLNKSGLFYLKKQGKYEVAATYPNTLSFFKGFFPKLQAQYGAALPLALQTVLTKTYFTSCATILNKIYEQLSTEHQLKAVMQVASINQQGFLYFSSNQKLMIDGKHMLDWEISQAYDVEDEEIKNRQGGHSDYRYVKRSDK